MVANIAGNPINVIMSNDMPIGTPELIRHNEDDSYTVMLNAKYDHETLEKGFKHAIDHIHRNDWEKEDVQIIEAQAHGLPEAPAAPAPDPDQAPAPEPILPGWLIRLIADVCAQAFFAGLRSGSAPSRYGLGLDEWRPPEDDTMRLNEALWLYDI